ncbi:MAG: hypothetical protein J6Y93_05855, partial [Treponema sp.]|nr:hypothetical protein [Treponema sp.]
ITYDNWPYVKDVKLYYDSRYNMTMKMIAETLNYSPFGMKPNEVIKNSLGTDFFFPFVISPVPDLYSGDALNRCALYYEIPSDERPGARIRFSLLDGVPQIIRYYENDVMYAQTQCENGYPQIRIVDKDGDGLFETTEFYAMTDKVKQSPGKLSFSTFHSAEDSLQIIRNLYGFEYGNSGLYLKMIQIDQNGDTIPDFTEEYAENEGKTSSWDFDNDGNWDVRYVKHPQSGDGILREESLFHEPFTNQVKSVLFENSKPVKVFDGKTELPVVKGKANLYWLGKKGNDEISDEILKQNLSQGVCIIVETRESRALAVKFGKFIFGGILAGAQ